MGLESDDAYTTQLQAILRIAHGLREVAAASLPPGHTPSIPTNSPAVLDSIRLPSPCPLLPSLLEAGVGHEIASAASRIYLQRAEELRHHIQESIIATWYKIAELPVIAPTLSPDLLMRKVVSTATEVYLLRLAQWKEEITQRVKQESSTPPKAGHKSAFNHEYVPLLEHFFEENPFPTHADKMFLAKKSNMEYRQIHVWFQNRRNRTKKEGKTLRKKPTYEGATKPLNKLYECMKGHMIHSDSQAPKPSKAGSSKRTTEIGSLSSILQKQWQTEIAQNNMPSDAFTSASPPHAFPLSYPPTCDYDPFPCKSGPAYFGKPEWRRVPDGKYSLSLSTSIDDLVERFSHLNVRDGTRSKGSPILQSHAAATVAITVTPSRAPHPSLIVSKYSQPTNNVQLHPSLRAPVSCSKVFQSPSPTSKPVTLVPLSAPPNKSALPGKRKIAPLPQRFPGRMRNRDATPSESSSTSSSSPCLFSRDSESRSCSLSSVGSLSTPSDIANTQELPHLFGSPCRSPFNSPIHLRGFGGMVAISPSSVP